MLYTPFERGETCPTGGKKIAPGPCERIPGGGTEFTNMLTDTMRHLFVRMEGETEAFLFYAGQRMLERLWMRYWLFYIAKIRL